MNRRGFFGRLLGAGAAVGAAAVAKKLEALPVSATPEPEKLVAPVAAQPWDPSWRTYEAWGWDERMALAGGYVLSTSPYLYVNNVNNNSTTATYANYESTSALLHVSHYITTSAL